MTVTRLKTLPQEQLKTSAARPWLLALLRLWGLIVLSLHLAAFNLPEESAWSLWPYTWLTNRLGWLLALFVGLLIIPGINHSFSFLLYRLWAAWPVKHARRRWFALAAVLAGWLFWLGRLRHLNWGDGYLLSVILSYPDLELRVIYNWQAPLTVFLHQRLWQFVAGPLLGWPVEHVYAAISILCGVLFVYLLLTFTARLGREPLEAAILAGLMLTTGAVQLFFGYVENYTIVSLALLATLFLAWRALQGEIPPVWPALAFSIANAFHPSTVFLWPAMLLLTGLCWQRGRISLKEGLLQTILPPLLIGSSVFALMESGQHGASALLGVDRPGGGDAIWFVPLFEVTTEWQRYTMFSAAHLLDWGNLHLLISPFGIPLILLVLTKIYHGRLAVFATPNDKDFAVFLGVMSGLYLLFTWLWNPDYGARKDWDLFAPSAFIYTLWAGYLFVHTLPDREELKEVGLFMILVSLLHTAAWVFTNTHPLPGK